MQGKLIGLSPAGILHLHWKHLPNIKPQLGFSGWETCCRMTGSEAPYACLAIVYLQRAKWGCCVSTVVGREAILMKENVCLCV